MKKRIVGSAVVVFSLLLFGVIAVASDTIQIDGCKQKKAAVSFPHTAHQEVTECTTCHHTNEGLTAESGGEVQKCATCHLNPEEGTPDCASMSPSKNPYHQLCISCHKTEAKGPTKCNDCHPKE